MKKRDLNICVISGNSIRKDVSFSESLLFIIQPLSKDNL
jgi:hypothetical protein